MCEFEIEIVCKPISQPNFFEILRNFVSKSDFSSKTSVFWKFFKISKISINLGIKSDSSHFEIFIAKLTKFGCQKLIKMIEKIPFLVKNRRISMTNVNPRDISEISKHVSQKNDNFDKSRKISKQKPNFDGKFGIFLSKFLNGDFYRLNLIRKPFSEPFRNIRNHSEFEFRTVRVKTQNLKTKTSFLNGRKRLNWNSQMDYFAIP